MPSRLNRIHEEGRCFDFEPPLGNSYEEYHPYGTSAYRSSNGSVEVSARRYRYTGKERDEETGLYYYGARYYACWLGRWTSADPSGIGADGPGLYNYTRGSPVTLTDPNGRASRDENDENKLEAAQTRDQLAENERQRAIAASAPKTEPLNNELGVVLQGAIGRVEASTLPEYDSMVFHDDGTMLYPGIHEDNTDRNLRYAQYGAMGVAGAGIAGAAGAAALGVGATALTAGTIGGAAGASFGYGMRTSIGDEAVDPLQGATEVAWGGAAGAAGEKVAPWIGRALGRVAAWLEWAGRKQSRHPRPRQRAHHDN